MPFKHSLLREKRKLRREIKLTVIVWLKSCAYQFYNHYWRKFLLVSKICAQILCSSVKMLPFLVMPEIPFAM